MRFYYFGCENDDTGHYLWQREWHRGDCDQLLFKKDAAEPLCPKIDGGYAPDGPQHEGLALLHLFEGWTVVAFWDRSKDKRYGSNSAFIVEGTHTFDEVIAIAKEKFPKLFTRFGFVIKQVEQTVDHRNGQPGTDNRRQAAGSR